MKKTLIALLIIIFCANIIVPVFGQEFKGSILYSLTAESKNPNISNEQLINSLGTESTFYYENGSYIQFSKDGMLDYDYFDAKSKTYCTKYKANDTLYITDATKASDILISLDKINDEVDILDMRCMGVELIAKNSINNYEYSNKFFYSEDLFISGESFKGIKHGLMENVYGRINSIPIYFVIENPRFIAKVTAVVIKEDDTISVLNIIDKVNKGLIKKNL